MRGFAGFDRLFDPREHPRRESDASPPVVLKQMPGDAPDAHAYQLPDAPPPPKLPPPPETPPLSLLLPPDQEPPPPPVTQPPSSLPCRPRRTGGPVDAIFWTTKVTTKAVTPSRIEAASDPATNQANTPTMPPVASAPMN